MGDIAKKSATFLIILLLYKISRQSIFTFFRKKLIKNTQAGTKKERTERISSEMCKLENKIACVILCLRINERKRFYG